MTIKHYGLYDTVAKTLRSDFVSDNDEVALRSLKETAKQPGVDKSILKDCSLLYLYSIDSETGVVIDSSQREICLVASFLEDLPEPSLDDTTVSKLKDNYNKVLAACKVIQDNQQTFDQFLKILQDTVEGLKNKVGDIIGGKIKCQKYKKPRRK